jgi:hypothetical protein
MDNRGRSTRSSRTPLGSGSGLRWFLGFLAVALLVAVVPLRGAAPAKGWGLPGLVAAYGFDEGAGATTTDESGFGNTGAIAGATWTTDGRYGGALSFDGVNDWVTINDTAALDLTTGMTLEAWVLPSTLSGWRTVLLKERSGGLVYSLYTSGDGTRPSGYVATPGEVGVVGPSSVSTTTWTHLAVTYDGATLRLFVNGAQVATRTLTAPIAASTGALRIGGNSVWTEFFRGRIDEVRIYNRALTAAEIQADMSAPITP